MPKRRNPVASLTAPDHGRDDSRSEESTPEPGRGQGVLLVTGMSGAGKTSALKCLEDIGYEAMDNVPLSLLGSLVAPAGEETQGETKPRPPIAIGVDIRTRDFDAASLIREIEGLAAANRVRVLFLDCEDEELGRRYVETRHRHPLAADRPVADAIHMERGLLAALLDRADVTMDTTGQPLGDLKRALQGHFGLDAERTLSVLVTSFSFRHGLPRQADLVFDVRFLANPHYQAALRPLTGKAEAVAGFIAADPGYTVFFDRLTGLLNPLLPRYVAEGKSYLTVAIGCTGGRHRSVFVAERLARWFEGEGQQVHLRHRDLEAEDGENSTGKLPP